MELGVLGPVEARAHGVPINLGKRQNHLLLGILALQANHTVRVDRLVDLLWADDPPRQARAVVQTRISELRAAVNRGDPDGDGRIHTSGGGYRLDITPDLLDAHRFRALLAQAAGLAEADQVRAVLRGALGLWRGPVLGGGLPHEAASSLWHGLESARVTAQEDLYELEVRLGNGSSVLADLIDLFGANPGRERLAVTLMRALVQSCRNAEAIQAYHRCKRWLDEELGLVPGAELQELYLSLLRGPEPTARTADGGPPGAFRCATAMTLPPSVPDFTGREREVGLLTDLIVNGAGDGVAVAAVTGAAGAGKTALSIHVAHRLRRHFPDGQLFAELGRGGQAVPPAQVLSRFLRALGVDGSGIPETLDERIDLFRRLVAGRRILLVLDDVASAEQAAMLMPGSPGCAVVLNSRVRLGASIGAGMLSLGMLDPAQAVALLSRMSDHGRIAAEPVAALELARLCGYLPLAVRIASAILGAKPHWTVARMVSRLSDERRRLDEFRHGHLDVRSSIALSLRGLSEDARLLLRRLSATSTPEITLWHAAALLDAEPVDAEAALEELFDAQLLGVAGTETTGHCRYRLHDLVQLLGREYAERDEPPEALREARDRVSGAWLFVAEVAHRAVNGGDHLTVRGPASRRTVPLELLAGLLDDPLRWFDTERKNIAAVVRQLADDRRYAACWDLVCMTSPLFQMRNDYDTWPEVLRIAMAAVRDCGDVRGQAAIHWRTGMLCADRREYDQAGTNFEDAVRLFGKIGDRHGVAIATAYTGMIARWRGDAGQALRRYAAALPDLREYGDRGGTAFVLRSIGQVHLQRGALELAEDHLCRAAEISRDIGSRRGEAQVLFWMGMLRLEQRRPAEAAALFGTVRELTAKLGDHPGQVQALRGLGLSRLSQGDTRGARAILEQALEMVRQPVPTFLEAHIRRDLAAVPASPSV